MKEWGIASGIITIALGICVILLPYLLSWIVGGIIIITGIVYIYKSVQGKKGIGG